MSAHSAYASPASICRVSADLASHEEREEAYLAALDDAVILAAREVDADCSLVTDEIEMFDAIEELTTIMEATTTQFGFEIGRMPGSRAGAAEALYARLRSAAMKRIVDSHLEDQGFAPTDDDEVFS